MLSEVKEDAAVTVAREQVGLELTIRNPMDADTREVDFFSKALPIQLADRLTNKQGQLVLWLGELLAMDAELRSTTATGPDGEKVRVQDYALRPEGRVNGEIVGTIGPGYYTIGTKEKRPVEAVLVPEAFAWLMGQLSSKEGKPGKPALMIDKQMPVYVTVSDPELGPVSITTRSGRQGVGRFYPDPDQTHVGLTIELSPTRVFDTRSKSTYDLRGGTLTLTAPDLRGKTEIRADLRLGVRPDAGEQGVASLLTMQTTVTELLDTEGALPLDSEALMQQVQLGGGVKLVNAPSGLFDALLSRNGDIASILGPVVENLEAGFTYADGRPTAASVRLNWDQANNQPMPGAWASLKPVAFDIDAQRVMTVRGGEDIELEVRVTEEFGDRWMGQLHPVLFDAKSGDRPVKVTIDGSSFRFPLGGGPAAEGDEQAAKPANPFKGAHVKAEVDLGSIEFGDNALLGKLLEWTDHAGERAVFEPVQVALVDGKISYDKFDLAVGNVRLRMDGEVDLASGEIVEMAVRVPGESLIRVFNELDGIINKDDYLSIPMSGPIRKPKVDSKLITQEVTRLLTKNLIERQKEKLEDKLFRKLREKVGVREDQPAPEDAPAQDKPEEQPHGQDKPAEEQPIEDRVRDELIEKGLDLLFGGRRQQQDDPEDP